MRKVLRLCCKGDLREHTELQFPRHIPIVFQQQMPHFPVVAWGDAYEKPGRYAAVPAFISHFMRFKRHTVCIGRSVGRRGAERPDARSIPHEKVDAGIGAQRIRPEARKHHVSTSAVRNAPIR